MTKDISSAGLLAIYDALGRKAMGKVAVKISTGANPAGIIFFYRILSKIWFNR
jgi:hypothetical protein